MMQSLLSALILLFFSKLSLSLKHEERAIVPTKPGQIGVNPVTLDLGEPSKWIGVNTEYLTELIDGGKTSTKWIGVNTEYLTENSGPIVEPVTGTPTKTVSVVTTSVGAIASTATADGGGLAAGDVSITFSPSLIEKLKNLAVEVCGGPAKRKMVKRAESCEVRFAQRVAAPGGGPMEFDFDLPVISAADVAAIVSAVGRTVVPTSGATGVALLLLWIWNETGDMPNTLKVPKENIGEKPTTNSASTSSSACPTGSNSPVCQNSKLCNSPDKSICTTSVKYDKCSCVNYANIEFHPATPENLQAAQTNLASMSSLVLAAPTASMESVKCMADGAPWMLPTSWCDCGPTAKYSTLPPATGADASSTTGANCAYTVLPSKTIEPISNSESPAPTNIPGMNGVSGCAYRLAGNEGLPDGTPNFCFCGGGPDVSAVTAPLLTHTDVDPAKTDCNYKTQPSSNWELPIPESKTSPGPPTPTCGQGYGDQWNMRQASAMAAATSYCASKASQAAGGAEVANNWPGTCTQQNKDADYQPPAHDQVEEGMSDLVFSAGLDTQTEFCKDKSYSDVKVNEDDCNTALSIAINGCNTDTTDKKQGGSSSVNCMKYSIRPAPFGNGYPCFGQFCSYGWVDDCSPR